MRTLDQFFNPSGVAVVGASGTPGKLGYGVVRNLTQSGYQGTIYPVNPRAREILGRICYQSISDVPDPCELAVIIVPATAVIDVIRACGERGIRHAIVASGGFGETGKAGLEQEHALQAAAASHQIRLVGPNCIGTIDTRTPLNTTFITGAPQVGDIGFISQSGAMCAVVINWAAGTGVGFSRIASLGNQVDVNESEMLEILAGDPNTRVITLYLEGVVDGQAFLQAAEAASRQKPVIVLKGGRGEAGITAVASHTGVLAGNMAAYKAAFDRCGVLQPETMESLFDWAQALAWQPLPAGDRVAVLTNAGGPGIVAVDALEAAGLRMASLATNTMATLRSYLPKVASSRNPVDILAGSGPELYAKALGDLLADTNVDAVLVIQAPQDWFLPEDLAQAIADVAGQQDKPVLVSLMGLQPGEPASVILKDNHIPNYAFPERAAGVMAAMVARRRWLDVPPTGIQPLADIDQAGARQALSQADFEGALDAYGISFSPARLAKNPAGAVDAARSIGLPVALKIVSPDVSHKSDSGGVLLDLESFPAVQAGYSQITEKVASSIPGAQIDGVLVQRMFTGQELIIGVKRDPQFGPLLLVGTGGIEVELKKDIATALCPQNRIQAETLLDSTVAGTRLRGWRSIPAADRKAVLDVMFRLVQLTLDFPEISEVEINPLIALAPGLGAIAVDVRGAFASENN